MEGAPAATEHPVGLRRQAARRGAGRRGRRLSGPCGAPGGDPEPRFAGRPGHPVHPAPVPLARLRARPHQQPHRASPRGDRGLRQRGRLGLLPASRPPTDLSRALRRCGGSHRQPLQAASACRPCCGRRTTAPGRNGRVRQGRPACGAGADHARRHPLARGRGVSGRCALSARGRDAQRRGLAGCGRGRRALPAARVLPATAHAGVSPGPVSAASTAPPTGRAMPCRAAGAASEQRPSPRSSAAAV